MLQNNGASALILSAFLLAGCASKEAQQAVITYDIERERQAFTECLAALPAGPQAARYNDWDEVVQQCRGYAYGQARQCRGTVDGCGFYYMTPITVPGDHHEG